MSWKKNAMMQRTFEAPNEQEAVPSNEGSGDSSILRYIKTLTSHQTNAKQQRMDRFLQQVKHHEPAKTAAARPPRYRPVFKAQDELKSSVSMVSVAPSKQVKNTAAASKKQRPVAGKSKVSSGHSKRGKAGSRKNESRPRGKRPYEREQNDQQRKKPKRALPSKQKKSVMGSLERFLTASEKCAGSELSQLGTVSFSGNKFAQHENRSTSRTTKSICGAIGAGSEQSGFEPLPPTALPTRTTLTTTEEPRSSSFQSARFLSPEQVQLEDLEDVLPTEEGFIPAYDPLSSIMESIYF